MASLTEELRAEVDRIHEALMWASESQFANCKIWRAIDQVISIIAAAAAGIAGVAGLADLISASGVGAIAIVSAAFGAVNASLGAGRIASKSTVSANQYRNLQQEARVLRNIDLPVLDYQDARSRLGQIMSRQHELNESSPVPLSLAFWMARRSIERGSQRYAVDRQ